MCKQKRKINERKEKNQEKKILHDRLSPQITRVCREREKREGRGTSPLFPNYDTLADAGGLG